MHHIDWAHWARVAVWTVIGGALYFGFVLWIARKVQDAAEEQERLAELARLRAALVEADARVEAARLNSNKVVREAERLGFFDGQPPRAA